MKKSDLIKLLETASDDQDINELILGNEEFKNLGKVDLTKLTVDEFKSLLTTNEGIKGYQQSLIDSAVSKGVASYETNTLPKKIEEAIKQAGNKNKTPEQIALEELQAKFEKLEKEKNRAELMNKYTKTLTEKGLDAELIDFIFDETEEGFNTKLDSISALIQSAIDKGVQAKINGSNYDPPKGGKVINNPWKKGQINLTEQARILKENPTLAEQLKASANKE